MNGIIKWICISIWKRRLEKLVLKKFFYFSLKELNCVQWFLLIVKEENYFFSLTFSSVLRNFTSDAEISGVSVIFNKTKKIDQ